MSKEVTIPTELPKFDLLITSCDLETQSRFFTLLSQQVGQWSRYNFGIQQSHRPAMGMAEELCELGTALDQRYRDGVLDAVGDVTIYMADYYAIRGWDLGEAWRQSQMQVIITSDMSVLPLIERLSHSHLKGEQNIRGGSEKQVRAMQDACVVTLHYLDRVCHLLGRNYPEVIRNTWDVVKLRDWRANRDDAHKVAEAKAESSGKEFG